MEPPLFQLSKKEGNRMVWGLPGWNVYASAEFMTHHSAPRRWTALICIHLCLCIPDGTSSFPYLPYPQDYSARGWISPIPYGKAVTELLERFRKIHSTADLILPLMLPSPAHILARGCLAFIEMYTKYQFRETFSWVMKSCGLVTKLSFVFQLVLHGYSNSWEIF